MPSLLNRGTTWLNSQLDAASAETVSYLRGANVCEGLRAIPSSGRIDQQPNAETAIVSGRYDWIVIDTNALRINGDLVTPESGDVIRWVQSNGNTMVFEVNSDGDQVWEPSGPYPSRIRIHTKYWRTIPAI